MSFEEYCGPDEPDDSHTINREDIFWSCFQQGDFEELFEKMDERALGKFNDPAYALSKTFIAAIKNHMYLPYILAMIERGYCFPGGYRSTLYVFIHEPDKFGLQDLKVDLYFLEIVEMILECGGPHDYFFGELLEEVGHNRIELSKSDRDLTTAPAQYLCKLAEIYKSGGTEDVLARIGKDQTNAELDLEEVPEGLIECQFI
ncbi:MAG: hypothetical protein F9K32_00905 [Desulfobulbaceae bacterium]|nr:MAG: hypothetical protein F9K32_00905 [Desulfobulbaceae bacterium]